MDCAGVGKLDMIPFVFSSLSSSLGLLFWRMRDVGRLARYVETSPQSARARSLRRLAESNRPDGALFASPRWTGGTRGGTHRSTWPATRRQQNLVILEQWNESWGLPDRPLDRSWHSLSGEQVHMSACLIGRIGQPALIRSQTGRWWGHRILVVFERRSLIECVVGGECGSELLDVWWVDGQQSRRET